MGWISITIRVKPTGPADLLWILNSLKGRCEHIQRIGHMDDFEIVITWPVDPIMVERDKEP